MSLTTTKRELKVWRQRQAAARRVLNAKVKPDSWAGRRAKYERIHDAWRAAVGLPAVNRYADATGQRWIQFHTTGWPVPGLATEARFKTS